MIDIALVATLIVGVLMVARQLERWWISVPMALILLSAPLGHEGLDFFSIRLDADLALELTEVTLGLLLFADAAGVRLRAVAREAPLESRLLAIGLPLTVALGAAVAWLVFDGITLGMALLIGAALAPTDAALGLPIFSNPNIPQRVRQALNVESGLNDGIVTPIVAFAISLSLHEAEHSSNRWLQDALEEIAIAVAVAVISGLIGGWLIRATIARGWSAPEHRQLMFCGLGIAIFFGARELGGNGFIAAFVGGLMTAVALGDEAVEARELTEGIGAGLSNFVWVFFGAALVPLAFDEIFSWRSVLYAVLALTVGRMLPVALAMRGARLRRDTVAIMGWFGPRGLASVVFLITAYVAFVEAGDAVEPFAGAMVWTILLSVFLHGITATPFGERYGRRLQAAGPGIAEREGPVDPVSVASPHG